MKTTILLFLLVFTAIPAISGDIADVNIDSKYLEEDKSQKEADLTDSVSSSSCALDANNSNPVIMKSVQNNPEYSFDCGDNKYTMKRLVHTQMVDFQNVLSNTFALSQAGQMLRVNMVSGKMEAVGIKHYIDYSKLNSMDVMIRQLGTFIYFVPTTERQDIQVDNSDDYFKSDIAGYLSLTYERRPVDHPDVFKTKVSGKCQDLGYDRAVALNISQSLGTGTCLVDGSKPSYLTWYLFEK